MVYAKIDWYTVLLYNVSFEDVLKKLNCVYDICDEIMNSGYQHSQGYRTDMIYSVNGVTLSVDFDDVLEVNKDYIFLNKWKELRLDISGSGLDYLRTLNKGIDANFCDVNFWGREGTYKITRCDFAFDFVNHYGSFLDEFIYKLQDMERAYLVKRDSEGNFRLNCEGNGRNTTYNMRTGSNVKCLYLGTTRSDKLVRIYDKKLEQTKNGVFIKGVPQYFQDDDKNVNSWFRIEFQTRRKLAQKYLFGCMGSLKSVLRELFEIYQCKDPVTKQPFEFIKKLFDWSSLPKIIENLHFTELAKKVLVKAKNQLETQAVKNLVLFYGRYGIDGILSIIENYLNMLNRANKAPSYSSVTNPLDYVPLREINSNIAFRCRYSQLLSEEGLTELPFLHYKNDEFHIGDWRTVKGDDPRFIKRSRSLDDYTLRDNKFLSSLNTLPLKA